MIEQTADGKTALVLGATGGIGGAVARGLAARGWRIRALNRNAAEAASREPGFDWRQGDAMQAADVLSAAEGVDLIVHAVNPPGYRNWAQLVLPMLDSTIAAAKAVGAGIVLPGTVYNFGPEVLPQPNEDSPQRPRTRKGAIRVEMERRLKAAAETGTRVIILRAGDFFGPHVSNNWFSQGLITPGKPVTSVTYPGKPGIGHQWAYLPDVAETIVRLVESGDSLPTFAVYHMRGHWDGDGRQMIGAIERSVGHKVKAKAFPWWLLPFAAPFVPLMKELREMRYLWNVPLQMGNDRLVAVLGEEPHTPIDEAVKKTLAAIGCLPAGR
ncbi:MAG: NAD(P)H-binding protein [Rhizobiaceae bacterium]|nr:NAD(P)H-binding protein [Rhizobiaceae bacterium]